jgi:hypothetical protein
LQPTIEIVDVVLGAIDLCSNTSKPVSHDVAPVEAEV